VVNTASPYCSFEDCATKLNYVRAWLIEYSSCTQFSLVGIRMLSLVHVIRGYSSHLIG